MLAGRALAVLERFGAGGAPFDARLVRGNGTLEDTDPLRVRFRGAPGAYELRVAFDDTPLTGVGARLRLTGWDAVRYVAVGLTTGETYRHVKMAHVKPDGWFEFGFDVHDLLFRVQNGDGAVGAEAYDAMRIFVSGTPCDDGAEIAVSDVFAWRSDLAADRSDGAPVRVDDAALGAILRYWDQVASAWPEQAEAMLTGGDCPVNVGTMTDWALHDPRPAGTLTNKSLAYSWHAAYPALVLLRRAAEGADARALCTARGWVQDWLASHADGPASDRRYVWYDHGVAERLLVLIVLAVLDQRCGPDVRFAARLRAAIVAHARLLASGGFYAFNQVNRYHNHAWFQDAALLATGVLLPGLPGAAAWRETALERIADQFGTLIVREDGYAVFAENSIGYHRAIMPLVRLVDELIAASGVPAPFGDLWHDLDVFWRAFRYPDDRAMTVGDSFRLPNPAADDKRAEDPFEPGLTVLPRAGYAIAKGRDGPVSFVLCQAAPSVTTTHKHEDDLALAFYADGVEWLCDPSFFSHGYDEPLPAFLRSAAAHCMARVPDAPYRLLPGASELSGSEQAGRFRIDGESRAMLGVIYSRRVEGRLDTLGLTVTERLRQASGESPPPAGRLAFQLGDGVRAEAARDGFVLRHPASTLALRLRFDREVGPVRRVADRRGEDGTVGGVIGLGFMQAVAGETIDVPMPPDGTLTWTISRA